MKAGEDFAQTAAVIGVGQTDYTRQSGRSEWELANEAIGRALDDAQVDPSEVDGLVRSASDVVDEAMVLRTFPMRLTYYGQIGYGGVGLAGILGHARAAIASGQARAVVVYRSLNGYSKVRFGRAERAFDAGGSLVARGDRAPSGAFAGPYGLLSPGQVMAMWARRYQAKYALDDKNLSDALAVVAVGQRAYAQRNPDAIMRERPLSSADYYQGRMISEPLRLYDFALESDGAAAMVVAGRDMAMGQKRTAVWIRAAIQGLVRYGETINIYGELRNEPRHRSLGRQLFEQSGVEPRDISVAMLYDATTLTVLLALEEYGFAEPGTAWRLLLEKGIGLDSGLPVNTSGGGLSEAYVHGFNLMIEAVRQCRGSSPNQVDDVWNVLFCSGPSAAILSC